MARLAHTRVSHERTNLEILTNPTKCLNICQSIPMNVALTYIIELSIPTYCVIESVNINRVRDNVPTQDDATVLHSYEMSFW